MNARQKAKKYKRELERLKKINDLTVVERIYHVVNHPVIDLGSSIYMHIDDEQHYTERDIRRMLAKSIANSEAFQSCLDIYVEDATIDQRLSNQFHIYSCRLKVVDV